MKSSLCEGLLHLLIHILLTAQGLVKCATKELIGLLKGTMGIVAHNSQLCSSTLSVLIVGHN